MKLNTLISAMDWSLDNALKAEVLAKDINLAGLALDSRRVERGYGFVAITGDKSHGNDYVRSAVEKGAVVVITDKAIRDSASYAGVLVIVVADLAVQLSKLVALFYKQTFAQLNKVYAVTGTNGKTTVAQILAQCLSLLDSKTAILGTAGNGFFNALEKAELTTMDVISSCEAMVTYQQQGAQNIAMEASSHGLMQQRLSGIPVATAILTNLTQDHLDYHHDMESYKQAKLRLFTEFDLNAAVINIDSEYAQDFIANNKAKNIITYSRKSVADVMLLNADISQQSMTLQCQVYDKPVTINTQLIGAFNIENILAVIAALVVNGYAIEAIAKIMPEVKSVAGRMQTIKASNAQPLVLVDFAHTPDALQNVLSTLKDINSNASSMLWAVFGCGGDRDKTKRPLMGNVANQLADKVVVTSDNPRSENAQSIIDEIINGITNDDVIAIVNREEAIHFAIKNAKVNDTVVIAGKGHETGQIIGNEVLPFNDSLVAKKAVEVYWS